MTKQLLDQSQSAANNSVWADKTLVDLLLEQARQTPNQIAVVDEQQVLTYRELDEQAGQLAHYLRQRGVSEETLIPVCLHRSVGMIVALLGILKAGGAYVPIDPDYPADRIRYILADVNGPVVLVDARAKTRLAELQPAATIVCVDSDKVAIGEQPIESPQTRLTPANAAYVIYTSGSTGRPKGVIIEHRNVVRLFLNDTPLFNFGADDVWTMFHSFCFDFSVWEIYGALLFGGKVVMVPKEVTRDSRLFGALLARERVTVLNQTPSAFYALQEQVAGTVDLDSVRYVIFGGEALNPARLKPWKAAFPTCQLINMYGITETTVHVTYLALTNEHLSDSSSLIGKAIPTLTTYVLDEEQREVAVGEVGELYVGGAGLARGYLNQPELTAQRFIPNPFSTGPTGQRTDERLYRSGDLARQLPDGNLEYQGRMDEQVKIRGYRIELGEIERVLVHYPGVQQAVVLAKADANGDNRLVGYVVMGGTADPVPFDRAGLVAHLQTALPDYMIPALLMPVEAIPLTSNGKVDRNALPNPQATDLLTTPYAPPGNPTQQHLIGVWKSVFGAERVGIHDNFFELGGNSLLAVKTVAMLQQAHGYDLAVTKLYQYPTVSKLADFIDGRQQTVAQPPLQNRPDEPSGSVAIIGMAGRFPGANTIEGLWQVLAEGRETTRFFTAAELDASLPAELTADPLYVKARGIIDGADGFDAEFFGLNSKLAEVMDPQQRVFLEIAWEVLEKTGFLPRHYGGRVGVWAGCGNNTYYPNNVLSNPALVAQVGAFQAMTVNEKDFIASRTAYQLNLKGPAVSVYSACSSSLLAITQAVDSLRNGQCEVAIAGGASITAPIHSGHLYEEGAMLSRDGHCRPFDAQAGGTVFSDGAGVVLLKPLEAAQRDGDTIFAVIKGVGVNNDGGGKGSFTAPNAEGQAGAIRMALTDARTDPHSISYVEAHGTATPLGDPIEIDGLKLAFGDTQKNQFCAIGSIKSNMGHLTAAAGVAGFIKTTLALHHRQVPPSLGFDSPNPVIDFANSPFFVNTALVPWTGRDDGPRRAGVSSFGVGGTNVHVVLEEYGPPDTAPPRSESIPARLFQLITWSAKSEPGVSDYASRLADRLQDADAPALADVAFTGQTTRPSFDYRRFVVAATTDDLIRDLQAGSSDTASTQKAPPDAPGELVFLFPGQGSQYLNMGRDLYESEPVYRQAVDRCAALLDPHLDGDIRAVLYPPVADEAARERLKNTRYTQPALFVTEYAIAQLWMSWGIEPSVFCGHSIGEFVAAHLAGVFDLADALMLIAARGRLISELPGGRMVSVRLPAEKIGLLLPPTLSIAAINSPRQCVVAGDSEAISLFSSQLCKRQIPNRILETSHAFHSAMMDPILDTFTTLVKQVALQRPQKPIVSSVSGNWLTDAQALDPGYWARHMRLPVRFADALQTLFGLNDPLLLEAGPGTVTTQLVRQQESSKLPNVVASLPNPDGSEDSDVRSMLGALGALWTFGAEPNWSALYAGQSRKRVDLPTYAFQRKRCWIDPVPARSLSPVPTVFTPQPDSSAMTTELIPAPASTPKRIDTLLTIVNTLLHEIAGIKSEQQPFTQSFLELGLDSLVLTQLSFSLRKKFELPISFRQLSGEYSSPAKLVAYLDRSLPPEAYQPPAQPMPVIPPPTAPLAPQNETLLSPVSAPLPLLPSSLPVAGSDAVASLVARQLDIMAQQLNLLRGGIPESAVSTPVALTKVSSPVAAPLTIVSPAKPNETPKPFGAGARIEREITSLTATQKDFLHRLVEQYNQKTASSKTYTQENRRWMADPRVVTGFKPLTKELVYPIVVERSKGSRLWDIDGNEYIDALNGFGSTMFGHQPDWLNTVLHEQIGKGYEIGPQHRLAGEVCRQICRFTNFDRAALCNTGSEAVMASLRLARTVTGRSLVVSFAGSYHGTFDEVVARGSAGLTTYPAALGILPASVQHVLILEYGTAESLAIIRERASELAAVLVEPVQSRRPDFQPIDFLRQVRDITAGSGTALIFDEVITGFRMHPGGAQALFGVQSDLASYGKVVGGGLPIGVIAGKSVWMDALDGGFWDYGDASYPEADITFFAGTFVRHPLALAAANASLLYMEQKGPALQQHLTGKAKHLADTLNTLLTRQELPLEIAQFGSLWKTRFTADVPYGELLFTLMRDKGIHIWDGFPCFMTEAHTDADVDRIIAAFSESVNELIGASFCLYRPQKLMNTVCSTGKSRLFRVPV